MKNLGLVFVSVACIGLYYESAQLKLFAMENKDAQDSGKQLELMQVGQDWKHLKELLKDTNNKGRISEQDRTTGVLVSGKENVDTLAVHFRKRHAAVGGTPIVANRDHPSLVEVEDRNENENA